MRIELTPYEARVIGSLIEKEITTPDHYPLSLNALTAACNQKSNRDPVLALAEREVQEIVDGLVGKHLVSGRSGFGSRVTKYRHRFCNQGFGSLELSPQELGVVCVLLLRGPQTPGELRSRAERLCELSDVSQVESVLEDLMQRKGGPLVARLPREPGKRESRYVHLFGGDDEAARVAEPAPAAGPSTEPAPPADSEVQRLDSLEQEVQDLRRELDALRRLLDGRSADG